VAYGRTAIRGHDKRVFSLTVWSQLASHHRHAWLWLAGVGGRRFYRLRVGEGGVQGSGFLKEKPQRLVGDKAYDSDPLDEALKEQGIEMIAPHRSNRKQGKT
jgi:hypothetical protein